MYRDGGDWSIIRREKAPNSKHQIPKKFQISRSKNACKYTLIFEIWDLRFFWNLEFGACLFLGLGLGIFADFCYNSLIPKTNTQTQMTLAERIAKAVEEAIDPMEEMPFLHDVPVEEVNLLIDEYLATIQTQLLEVISSHGESFLDASDSAGLCAICIAGGIDLPADTLLRTCQMIVEDSTQKAEYIADLPNGEPVYMVGLEIAI